MNQMRFKNLMVLHIHSDKTDNLDLHSIADEFVGIGKADLEYLENLIGKIFL